METDAVAPNHIALTPEQIIADRIKSALGGLVDMIGDGHITDACKISEAALRDVDALLSLGNGKPEVSEGFEWRGSRLHWNGVCIGHVERQNLSDPVQWVARLGVGFDNTPAIVSICGPKTNQAALDEAKAGLEEVARKWLSPTKPEVSGSGEVRVSRPLPSGGEGPTDAEYADIGRALVDFVSDNQDHPFLADWTPAERYDEVLGDMLARIDELTTAPSGGEGQL